MRVPLPIVKFRKGCKLWISTLRSPPVVAIAAFAGLCSTPPGTASAYTLQTLHSACALANCKDGDPPLAGFVMDSAGNLYGTTMYGGAHDAGVVFELTPNADRSKWTEHVLHAFCSHSGCTDGADPPEGNLVMDVNGSFYGTTQAGGKYGYGAIFRLAHNANGWTLSVLHSFNYNDGAAPLTLTYYGQATGVLWDTVSPLFGTAYEGSDINNHGLAYEFAFNGAHWVETILHRFTTATGPNDLVFDAVGNLYGTVTLGGKYGGGILYRLASGTWTETVLHNFCLPQNLCATGPVGRLLIDNSGNVFGATRYGGSNSSCSNGAGCGTIFEYANGGPFNIIYNFCSAANCTDGSAPLGGLIMDGSGDLLGTASSDGQFSGGTAFKLVPGGGSWSETTLYAFCSEANCADGKYPWAPLTVDAAGDLFGATSQGGVHNSRGTVFELKP